MKNIKVVKSEDFQYPTKEERQLAEKNFPDLENFNCKYRSSLDLFIQNKKSTNEYNLFFWNLNLKNKIGNLKQAYINVYVHYHKLSDKNGEDLNENDFLNIFQFNFYSEIFYYFLFSVRDVILQILNLYLDLGLKEKGVLMNTIMKKLTGREPELSIIEKLEQDLAKSSEIRNSFAHRFPKNQSDDRIQHIQTAEIEGFNFTGEQEVKPSEIMENINDSLIIMKKFILELKERYKIN